MASTDTLSNSPFIIAPNLGCPRFLLTNGQREYEFSVILLGRRENTCDDIRSLLEGKVSLQPLLFRFENKRAVRGPPISLQVTNVEQLSPLVLDFLKDPDGHSFYRFWPGIIKEKAFGRQNQFFRATLIFEIPKDVTISEKHRNFRLFDLLHQFPDGFVRVNSHAVIITTRDWQRGYTFYHATDLHISDRNDRILAVIKRKMQKEMAKKVHKFMERIRKKEIPPLEDRFININNNFRRFIKKCNRDAENGDLDLIFLTGDLLDYCIPSDGGKSVVQFKYENTNWAKLKNIILGVDEPEDSDAVAVEELCVPIFTTPGNHDYRAYHYSINWGKLYKLIGLKALEAWHYSDPVPATPPTSLLHSSKCLTGYWQEFSPFEDLAFILDENLFLVMDSGADSVLSFKDLITGEPALTGLSNEQIMWLNSLLQFFPKIPRQVFTFFHAPVINPAPVIKFFEKVRAFFKKTDELTLDGLKEQKLRESGAEDPRMDVFIDVKHGTISNNWDRFLEFALQARAVVINGHTHQVKEFRGMPTKNTTFSFRAIPFVLKKQENPMAIYYGDYSEEKPSAKWIEENKPFFLQTSALGPNSYRKDRNNGGYRIFTVKKGKLASFEMGHIVR